MAEEAKRARSKPKRALISIVVVCACLAGLAWCARGFQHALAYLPSGHLPPIDQAMPGGETVTTHTADGLALTNWLLPASSTTDRNQAVLVAHGNGGNLAGRVPLARELADRGFTVLLLGYRGYGGNPGKPSQDGLLKDAIAAREALLARGFRPDQIIYFGESIGTGVVTVLAAEYPPGALVLRSPFTSLHDVGATLIPIPPLVRFIMNRNEFPVADLMITAIAASGTPVTVLAGSADNVVPTSQSATIARLAREHGILFEELVIEGAGHNDALWSGPVVADAVLRIAEGIEKH